MHRAVYRGADGAHVDVAVKVLRPNVLEDVAVDLCVLSRASDLLATWAPRVLPSSKVDWRALLIWNNAGTWNRAATSFHVDGLRRRPLAAAAIPKSSRGIAIGAKFEQERNHVGVARPRRDVQRRFLVMVRVIELP